MSQLLGDFPFFHILEFSLKWVIQESGVEKRRR
jgi:hypothetical protein